MNHFNINLQATKIMGWLAAGESKVGASHMYLIEPNNIIKYKSCDNHAGSWAVWEPALDPKQALMVSQAHGGELSVEEQPGGFYFVTLTVDGQIFERRERTLALGYCMVAFDYWERKQKSKL